jgi:hypothetical protein
VTNVQRPAPRRSRPKLLHYRDQNGQDWADIVDFLTMYPGERRWVGRILGKVEATTAQ